MEANLKKMLFKGQSPVLALGFPLEAVGLLRALGPDAQTRASVESPFIIAFAADLAAAEKHAKAAAKCLSAKGSFWMAYPKGTSKKCKDPDLNRDTLHEGMREFGFEGVSLIALDDDWSCMRFKRA